MKNFCKNVLFCVTAVATTAACYGQGCSDAGFCTMGAMKPDQPFNKKIQFRLRAMELSFYRGKTTLTPIVYVATADMSFSMNSRNSFQVKLPYQRVHGNLGSTSGMGDISLCYTRNVFTSEKFDVNVTLGGKIPTNDSNLKNSNPVFGPVGKSFPMYYQTSLGTYDIIAGASLISKVWLFAAGIQHPFNKNGNHFLWTAYPDYPNQAYVKSYANAFELKRGTDVMIRVERNFRYSRFNFSIGALPIYRITRDETLDDDTNERFKPDGTTGLALSAIITAGYNFNVRSSVKVLYGKKFVDRKFNPDGLTRENVQTISYVYRF